MARQYTIERKGQEDCDLGNAAGNDLAVRITDDAKAGTVARVRISRGGIDFFAGKASKTFRRTSWSQLLDVLEKGVDEKE